MAVCQSTYAWKMNNLDTHLATEGKELYSILERVNHVFHGDRSGSFKQKM